MQIHLTSFIELTIILNQSQKQLFRAELFCINICINIFVFSENLGQSPWKNLKKSYSSNRQRCRIKAKKKYYYNFIKIIAISLTISYSFESMAEKPKHPNAI